MSETSSTGDGEDSWVQWFCSLQGHEMFCEVDRSYIEDGFNLYGLRQYVPNITECLDIILDRVGPEDSDEDLLQSSYMLYGLIHARYIITTNGLEAMRKKHAMQDFGCCPRMLCRASAVVPIGMRDEPKLEGVKLFCPSCQDVYAPWAPSSPQAQLDGAYFGTTFAHLFCMTYEITAPTAKELYVPRIFGFRIHREDSGSASAAPAKRRSAAAAAANNVAALEQDGSAGKHRAEGGAGGSAGAAGATAATAAAAAAGNGVRSRAAGGGNGSSAAAAAPGGGGGGGAAGSAGVKRVAPMEESSEDASKAPSKKRAADGGGSRAR